MKTLENWLGELAITLVGLVISALWIFREKTHGDRYKDLTVRITCLERDVERMEIENSVMAERVSNMADNQQEIKQDVKEILKTVSTMAGACTNCDSNSRRIK